LPRLHGPIIDDSNTTETKDEGRIDKYIEREFLMNKVIEASFDSGRTAAIIEVNPFDCFQTYRCRVVLTNTSSVQQTVSMLQQIPQVPALKRNCRVLMIDFTEYIFSLTMTSLSCRVQCQ